MTYAHAAELACIILHCDTKATVHPPIPHVQLCEAHQHLLAEDVEEVPC